MASLASLDPYRMRCSLLLTLPTLPTLRHAPTQATADLARLRKEVRHAETERRRQRQRAAPDARGEESCGRSAARSERLRCGLRCGAGDMWHAHAPLIITVRYGPIIAHIVRYVACSALHNMTDHLM